jgi:hypothetical protein
MRYPNAAEGLKWVFYGEILGIVGVVFAFVSALLGVILMVAGGVLGIMGLNKAKTDDTGYQMALYVIIASIVVSIIKALLNGVPVLGTLMSIVSAIVSLALIYYVCITTSNLLHSQGQESLSARGVTVWKLNLVTTIISIVCTLLAVIPILNILAAVVSFFAAIVALVGYVMYLLFLNNASSTL